MPKKGMNDRQSLAIMSSITSKPNDYDLKIIASENLISERKSAQSVEDKSCIIIEYREESK